MEFAGGLFAGILAALMLNIGKGIQKQKIRVLKSGLKLFKTENRKDALIWLSGIAMTIFSTIPYSVSLKLTESPSLIGSLTGIGLAGLVLYAVFILKEKLSSFEFAGMALIILSTSALGFSGALRENPPRLFEIRELVISGMFLFVLFTIPVIISIRINRMRGAAIGLLAGSFLGTAVFLGDAALVESGGGLFRQLENPYPYLALFSAACALVFTQVAFFSGRALEVVPCINSVSITSPLFYEAAVYGFIPGLLQLVFFAFLIFGVIIISAGKAAAAASGAGGQNL